MTLLCNSISFSRVCRDFWIQKLRFFPHCNFFFQTQVYQRVEQYRSFKKQEQSFTNNTLQMCRRDWINFDQQEKNFTCKALDVAFKKRLTNFFRLYLYFPDFPSIWWANSRIFKEFNTLYKPPLFSFKIRLKKYIINSRKSRRFEQFQYHRSLPVLQLQYL